MAPRLTVAPYVGASDAPPIDIAETEEVDSPYQVTQQVEQPESPVTHPSPKPKPKPKPKGQSHVKPEQAAAPSLITQPSQLTQPTQSQGWPWWVWVVALLLLDKRRR